MAGRESVKAEALPLFKIKQAKGRVSYRLFSSTVFVGICLIWFYRLTNIPGAGEHGRWSWIGMFMSELAFGIYWILTQSVRWNVSCYLPFKHRLRTSHEDKSPGVDIFVCTADPIMEPPAMVMNTILSVMAYNYPPEKLSIYLSDDGGSDITFYALLEASHFSKYWIPFCRKFNIEPRSPEVYFSQHLDAQNTSVNPQEWFATKTQYEDLKKRIEAVVNKGSISEEIKNQHKGFLEWSHNVIKQNHHPIVKIVIDGRDEKSVDNDGIQLPTLVYLAREKRLDWPHNFKAGAMNAVIRVSSEISNGEIILNLDCDMYANNADAIREALCFFMDEHRGHQIAYVQHPQHFNNIIKNDLYANNPHVVNKVELAGMGGYGAALYCGTGCFHRRTSLCGSKYCNQNKQVWNIKTRKDDRRTINELEDRSKVVASCSHEKGTQWGNEMGLVYGCPVEDIVTGLMIQCRGWKSVYYNPEREAFLGVAPTTLDVCLVQFKRWSEGMFQIFFSKYCPFIYGHKKIKPGAQMGYCIYLLWAPLSLPTMYYVVVPPLCLLHGIPLFPEVSSLWFLPFAFVFISRNIYSIIEAFGCGGTLKTWWNLQRMVTIRRTTSFLFAFVDTTIRNLGLSQTTFVLTAKVAAEDVSGRYEQEMMEFGSSSVMFTIIATLAMLNLISLGGAVVKTVLVVEYVKEMERLISQVGLCALVAMLNAPVYKALFLRKDKGCLPFSVMFKSIVFASLACLVPLK